VRSQPNPELENPQKFFGLVEETIAVAGRMSRKIIIYRMRTPERMGDQMVGLPFILDQTTANVTSATSLGEDLFSFATG
jgi:hypothetical protein